MVMLYWSVDSLLLQLSINHNVDAQNQRCSYGNGATLLVFKDVRTVTWQPKFLRSMGYQILRYGTPSARELRLKVMGKNGTLVAENGRVNLGNEH